jgi:MYXO-CTERM domain-containing protein
VAYARDVAIAECGALGCGERKLEPAPLKPEEGCAIARVGAEDGGAGALIAAAVLVAVVLRRRRRSAGDLAVVLALLSLSCSSKDGLREGQSAVAPLTVKLLDPIPTYKDGELQISVGEGRTLVADVAPVDDLEMVELHGLLPDETFARVAHAPFNLFLPKSAPGAEGKRLVCITATDARGGTGETCFSAVR